MISVELVKQGGDVLAFRVTGHAGYAKKGSDIVCSAVTAVVYGALGALEELCGMKDYEDVEDGKESDYIAFELPKDVLAGPNDKAKVILQTMVIGLKQIEFVYDEYITINEREV
ncbi:MAG: ribosomal-processing cysteine protease Prp [Bacillota bacterium]